MTSPLLTQLQRCRSMEILGGAKNFFPNFRKLVRNKIHKKKWHQKEALHVILGAIFAHIFKVLLRFSGILWRFSEILPRFPRVCPNFHQIKTFGGALAPLHPHRPHQRSTATKLYDATWYLTRITWFVKLLPNQSLEAPHPFFLFAWKKLWKFFGKSFWAIQRFRHL